MMSDVDGTLRTHLTINRGKPLGREGQTKIQQRQLDKMM